jgi:hypothetical protein
MSPIAKIPGKAHNYFLIALCFLFSAITAALPMAAQADLSSLPSQPLANFAKPNNEVDAMAVGADGTLYIGGAFTMVGGQKRNHVAAINPDGTLNAWDPNANGTVDVILVSGSTIYIGGEFTTVGGQTRNHIAAVNTSAAVSSWDPNANDTVSTFVLMGSTLYVGGDFVTIGGQSRNYAAGVNTSTGAVGSWNPNPNDSVFALATDGTTIYMGGYFISVGGTPRNRLAAVDATAGTVSSWNPNANSFVAALAVSNGIVYAGGDFTTMGNSARHHVAAIDTGGTILSWAPDVNDLVATIAISGTNIFLGGDLTSINGQTRNYAGLVDASGTLSSWNPNASSSVAGIVVNANTVYAGGLFTTIGGQAVPYLAAYAASSGTTGDTTPPQATILSPTTGTVLTGQTTVTVTASDNVGVTQVELYVNGVKLSTDTVAPYSFTFSPDVTLSASYSLVAKAYDAAGNVGNSQQIIVTTGAGGTTGDTTPPQVTILSPTTGTVLTGQTTVTVSASDNVGVTQVELWVNGVKLNTDTVAPYSFTFSPDVSLSASYSLVAKAYDAAGNIGASQAVIVTTGSGGTGTTSGQVATPVISPNGGSFTTPITVSLTDATAGAVIHYTIDGTTPTATSPVYPASLSLLLAQDTTVKAAGFKDGMTASPVASAFFSISFTDGGGDTGGPINPPVPPTNVYPTGSLINENGTIYVVIGTSAVPFTNMAAFKGLGYQLKYVVAGSLDGYTKATSFFITTANMAHPWGAWLKVDSTHYYYSHESGLIRSPSAATFNGNRGQQKFILPANKYDKAILYAHPGLDPLTENDPRVY